jgi:membrane-bound serine protease (ClpP class)
MLLSMALLLTTVGPAPAALATPENATGKVFVLPIQGPIDKAMLFVFRRAFREVKQVKPKAIVLELETPGGGLKETEEIIAWLRSVDVPKYAFVNTHAQSAGAIISLATDKIFMAPGSRIGSAMPIAINPLGGGVQSLPADIKEKLLSDVRAMVRGLAQENGHSEDLAEAMVDAAKEVKIGEEIVSPKGELLNLTAQEAAKIIPPSTTPVLATAIVGSLAELLEHEGLGSAEIVRFQEQEAERISRYITMLGPLLLALGLLGVYIEFKTPGFGLPGIAGIACLTLYFFGHFVAGLAGAEEIVLVMVGFTLLAVEIFVIPGFGVTGIAGLCCIVAGITLSLLPHLPKGPVPLPGFTPTAMKEYLDEALLKVLFTIVLTGFGAWLLAKILPKTSFYHSLILTQSLPAGSGLAQPQQTKRSELIGQTATTITQLHPAGIATIGNNRYDVISTGDMIPKGTLIRIVEVEGNRIVVEKE